jgi:ABC-type branched-subunit amino acid transport system ATPase component
MTELLVAQRLNKRFGGIHAQQMLAMAMGLMSEPT